MHVFHVHVARLTRPPAARRPQAGIPCLRRSRSTQLHIQPIKVGGANGSGKGPFCLERRTFAPYVKQLPCQCSRGASGSPAASRKPAATVAVPSSQPFPAAGARGVPPGKSRCPRRQNLLAPFSSPACPAVRLRPEQPRNPFAMPGKLWSACSNCVACCPRLCNWPVFQDLAQRHPRPGGVPEAGKCTGGGRRRQPPISRSPPAGGDEVVGTRPALAPGWSPSDHVRRKPGRVTTTPSRLRRRRERSWCRDDQEAQECGRQTTTSRSELVARRPLSYIAARGWFVDDQNVHSRGRDGTNCVRNLAAPRPLHLASDGEEGEVGLGATRIAAELVGMGPALRASWS